MKTTVEALIECPQTTAVFCFDRGPMLKEIGRMAIKGEIIQIVLTKAIIGGRQYDKSQLTGIVIKDIRIDFAGQDRRLLFEAIIVSQWMFLTSGLSDRHIQGCIDQNRRGLFIFPHESGVYLF